jgi:hypothetical protein
MRETLKTVDRTTVSAVRRAGAVYWNQVGFMVVRIRFGKGPVVARRKGKNSRIALLGAGLLTLVSICLTSLGIWRLSQDVGLAGDFVFTSGLLSHWQVWMAAAASTYYACWRLSRYARQAREQADADAEMEVRGTVARLPAKV